MLSGIVIDVRDVQFLNASFPIDVTLFGILIDVIEVQPANARYSIEVTLFGIIVFLHPTNNLFVSVSKIALQSFLES